MDEVEQRILQFVIKEYRDLPEQGVAYYRMQVDAYRALEAFSPPDIPAATLRAIKRRSAAIDGDDFVGRKHTIENEVTAYRLLHGDEDGDIPRKLREAIRKVAKWEAGSKADYRTHYALYRRQIIGYRKLEKLRHSGLPEEELNNALEDAHWNHPGDFAKQYEEVCQRLHLGKL